MKLLLVGGTGILSTAVTDEALKQGITVSMINRGNQQHLIPKEVQLLRTDVHDYKKVISLLKGHKFDAVIDFICFTKEQVNYSYNLFKDFVNQYIFISSCAVYNTNICKYCDEDSPKVLNIWPYSVDKARCEDFLIQIAKNDKKHYTIIRPCVTYGNTRIPYGIMPPYGYHGTILKRIINGKPIITWDGAKSRCNIMRVEDFSIGVIGLIGNTKAYNEVFNICGDEVPSWKEVLNSIEKFLKVEIKTFDITSQEYGKEIPNREGEIIGGRAIDTIINNEKIKNTVPSFKQKIFLDEGIKMTIEHYISNNYLLGMDYAFDGDSDRIIAKYSRRKSISTKDMNLGFIDYIGHASRRDKNEYFLNSYKDNIFIRIFIKILVISKRIYGKIKFFRNK